MRNKKVLFAVQAAMIAALYVVLTYITNLLGLASGTIQVRFSEALCILPVFTPAAIPGLFIGCLISNLITGGIIWDIIFGSLATLLGAVFTYLLRKHEKLAAIPQKKEVCIHTSTCHRQHYYRATRAQIRIWFYNYIQGC